MGLIQFAENDLNRVIRERPDFNHAYFNRGVLHQRKENYRAALADFNQAHKLEYEKYDLFLRRGYCYLQLDLLKQACAELQQAERLQTGVAAKLLKEYCL